MLDILLTILTFSSMLVIFKYFEKFNINNLQAIIVNYITAGVCGVVHGMSGKSGFDFQGMLTSDYTFPALIIGFMFIFIFNLLAFGTQKIGISITMVANKMSMVIPVTLSILFFGDNANIVKILGILLALIAIYFTSTQGGKLNFNKKYLWLIAVIFTGQGIADTLFIWAQQNAVDPDNTGTFFATIFLFASLLGVFFLIFEISTGKNKLHLKSLLAGIVLGFPNYFTLFFFLRSLEANIMGPSQIFPVINMGVIVLSAIIGIIMFREKLSATNWIGILLATSAIALITFSFELLHLFS